MIELVVLSGKGGTGKSSLSAAFATLTKNVVVADCDVDAANLHLILKPENYREEIYISGQKAVIDYEKCTSCGICMNYCRFDAIHHSNQRFEITETSCDGCQLCSRVCPAEAITMVNHDKSRWYEGTIKNGKMVHARLSPGEDNSGKLVNIVRDQARETAFETGAEVILIDGPPGIGCPVISALSGTDKVVLVTEPTVSGLHDLKRIVELVNQFRVQAFVVINKYDLNLSMSDKIENWSTKQHLQVIGKIPFSQMVVDAMVNCESITNWSPASKISKEIKQIWNNLLQDKSAKSVLKT